MGTNTHARQGCWRAAVAAVCGALLGVATLTGSASAGESPIGENFTFKGGDTHIEQDAHPGWCPDVPFAIQYAGDAVAHFKFMARGEQRLDYYSSNGRIHDSCTNVENGRTFTVQVVWHESDVRVVDNGDGTLSITWAAQATSAVVAPDGTRVDRGAGRIELSSLVHVESDELISETVSRISGSPFHYYQDPEHDICGDVLEMLS